MSGNEARPSIENDVDDEYEGRSTSQTSEPPRQSPTRSTRNAGKHKVPTFEDSDETDEAEIVVPSKTAGSIRKKGAPSLAAQAYYGGAPRNDVPRSFHKRPTLPEKEDDEPAIPDDYGDLPLSQTRAHELKRQFLDAGGLDFSPTQSFPSTLRQHQTGRGKGFSTTSTGGSAKRPQAAHDPESIEIKRLRAERHLSWAEIARVVNAERMQNGGVPNLTEAGAYSRFVRNAARIAAREGYGAFDVRDHMHLREPRTLDAGFGPGATSVGVADSSSTGSRVLEARNGRKVTWTRSFDEMLIESCHEVKQSYWADVSELMEKKTGRRFDAVACAERFGLL